MPRRRFLEGAAAVTGIVPLCCMTEALPSGSVAFAPARITVDLARVPALRRTGAAFRIVEEGRKINLILIHAERGRYVAMDRSCTHGGAQCTYNPKRRTLQCTSLNHAEFDLQGTLLHGRTHGNLRTYQTAISGETVEIRLERNA
jgi:nitrite reductase/ring-hydroxylating ferredoxin subunit